MKRKDILTIIFVAGVAGLISFVISNALFNSDKARKQKAPVVEKIDPTFPDVANDSNYNSFLNPRALDPTQPVQIGNNQNNQLFIQ